MKAFSSLKKASKSSSGEADRSKFRGARRSKSKPKNTNAKPKNTNAKSHSIGFGDPKDHCNFVLKFYKQHDSFCQTIFKKITDIQKQIKIKFYSHFVRQPMLSLLSVKELLRLEKQTFENTLRKLETKTSGVTGTKVNKKFLQIYHKKHKDESLPKIPTYILFGIYVSNYYSEQIDNIIINSIIKQKTSTQKVMMAKNALLQRVISIVQSILQR